MNYIELLAISIGVAMDAFAVSICKGLMCCKIKLHNQIIVGLYFGLFQAIMPLIGYILGIRFQEAIVNIDHWMAFIMLTIIGINMIKSAQNNDEENIDSSFAFRAMMPLAVATSIDALAVGVTFAFLNVTIIPAISFIGVTTFIISAIGVKIGGVFGCKYKSKAEIFGAVVLILIGLKILLEHLGILR